MSPWCQWRQTQTPRKLCSVAEAAASATCSAEESLFITKSTQHAWINLSWSYSLHPYSNNDPARYRLRSATGTNYTLFHVRGRNLETELSPWPGQSWGAVCQRQFVTRTVYTLLDADSNRTFFSLCFNDWQCNARQVRFRAYKALNSFQLQNY